MWGGGLVVMVSVCVGGGRFVLKFLIKISAELIFLFVFVLFLLSVLVDCL